MSPSEVIESTLREASAALEAVPALIEALRHEDEFMRMEAAETLGEIGPEARQAIPTLNAALQDEVENVRRAAVEFRGNPVRPPKPLFH